MTFYSVNIDAKPFHLGERVVPTVTGQSFSASPTFAQQTCMYTEKQQYK